MKKYSREDNCFAKNLKTGKCSCLIKNKKAVECEGFESCPFYKPYATALLDAHDHDWKERSEFVKMVWANNEVSDIDHAK